MASQIGDGAVLFSDDFSSKTTDGSRWDYNHAGPAGNDPANLGQTEMKQKLPVTKNGALHLQLDTYFNGTHFSGDEAVSRTTFSLANGGVAFETVGRFVNPVKGLVAGMFPFNLTDTSNPKNLLHDEIDWEALSNKPNQIQTNVYANEKFGAGHVVFANLSSPLTNFHTYRIEWLKDQVRWFVDNTLVRTEKVYVPQGPMPLHLNIWVPQSDRKNAYDPSLKPATTSGASKSYGFDVKSVTVTQLATKYGGKGDNNLAGSAKDDWIDGGPGIDRLEGKSGHDTLFGRSGDDVLKGKSGDDTMNGGKGDDTFNGHGGEDTMTGGKGADVFTFSTELSIRGVDHIKGFEAGIDAIRLKAVVFAGLGGAGPLAESAFHIGAAAADGDDRIIYNTADGSLSYDDDGTGANAAIRFAVLDGGLALSHGDFIVT